MKATVVDLRYGMNEVLKALDRREEVTVLYHGKIKGTIVPSESTERNKIVNHPFFGMRASDAGLSVPEAMDKLRKGRYDDL